MKLSTRATYGLRAMLVLAMEHGSGPIMVKRIADRQNLPSTYLEQLLSQLRKAQLVRAVRGAAGGYELARRPEEITLLEVIETLEGPLDLVDCSTVASCYWKPEQCALKDLLGEASRTLSDVFSRTTLFTLAERQRTRDI